MCDPVNLQCIFFMHIPKTGGTLVNKIFLLHREEKDTIMHAEQFSYKELQCIFYQGRAFVSGHVYLRDFNDLVKQPNFKWKVITFIRSPIYQLASHMRWIDHYNMVNYSDNYISLDIEMRRLVDEIRTVDFLDPGSVDHYLTNFSPMSLSYFDNNQSKYFLKKILGDNRQSSRLTLNVTPEILSSMEEFEVICTEEQIDLLLSSNFNINDSLFNKDEIFHNINNFSRAFPLESPVMQDVLRKHVLVDEWLYREVKYRWKTGKYKLEFISNLLRTT